MIAAQGDLAVAVFVDEGSSGLGYRRPDPGAVPARGIVPRDSSERVT